MATGEPRFDAAGSLAIGSLLVVIAAVLAVEMKSLLIGEAAAPEVIIAIEQALCADSRVVRLIHMRTEHLGPDELLVAAKLELSAALSVSELVATINDAETRVRGAVPLVARIYIEPDVFRPSAGARST
jgi:divalent metal cation (Fe/Co/Zn/Cd) transporter